MALIFIFESFEINLFISAFDVVFNLIETIFVVDNLTFHDRIKTKF